MVSAFILAVAAPPLLQADAPRTISAINGTEILPPGALVFRGPNAGSPARANANANGANTNAATSVVPANLRLPPDLAEVVRLASSGMEEQSILSFVQNSPLFAPLTPEQIVYLKDLGLSPRLLTALLQHQRPGAGTAAPVPETPDVATGPEGPYPGMTPEEMASSFPEDYGYPPALPGPGYFNPVDYGYVYNALSPYGAWVFLPGFGWSWQPTIGRVCRDWRPYCDNGNWRWSECGWYWDSHYTWGRVPFHYGRWSQHAQYGWLWHPDRVWAPAWVSWRSSNEVCGWAPLPPGANYNVTSGWSFRGRPTDPARGGFGLSAAAYTFVDPQHFRQPGGHGLSTGEAQNAFRRTTPAERNGFVFGANQRIVNRGIDPFRVETVAREAARPVAVSFPGGASFTAGVTSGQLPFNVTRRAHKADTAQGGSTPSSIEPQGGAIQGGAASPAGGGGGAANRHVPQYRATRTVAEASGAAPQAQTSAAAGTAVQTAPRVAPAAAPTAPMSVAPFARPAPAPAAPARAGGRR